MKSKTEYLTFNTKTKRAFVNITPGVRKIVQDSKIKEGLCLVNAMHITASVFINDNESGLHGDFDIWLEKLAPHSPTEQYRHNETGEDNADAHLPPPTYRNPNRVNQTMHVSYVNVSSPMLDLCRTIISKLSVDHFVILSYVWIILLFYLMCGSFCYFTQEDVSKRGTCKLQSFSWNTWYIIGNCY
jgi:secondary thiamine-phosphate synthase enzyme